MLLKILLLFVSASALCWAQVDDATSSGTGPNSHAQNPSSSVPDAQQETAAPAAPAPEKKATAAKPAATSAESKKPYVIGPLDVLMIKVWNNPNLSGPANVGSDGTLSLPLIGEVKADGLTQKQLKEALTERLKEFLNTPEVDVQIGKVNSKRYFVYGGVLRAGEFPLIQDTTVMDAMSLVGGFKEFANPKKIRIQRGTQEFIFNYKDVSRGKKMEQNILLENGDRIFVPE